jgi:ATP-binding cassette subfamily B protein
MRLGLRRWLRTLRIVRRLLRYIFNYWQLKAVILLVVFTTILEIFTPAIIGSIIDMIKAVASGEAITPGSGIGRLIFLMLNPVAEWASGVFSLSTELAVMGAFSASLIVVAVLTGVGDYLQRYASSFISQKASFDIRRDLYNSLLDQSFSFYDRQRTGQLMSRATSDIRQIESFFGVGLTMLVSTGLLSAMVVYSLLSINWRLTLMSMAFLPLMLLTIGRFAMKMGPLWIKMRGQFGDMTSVLQENLTGVRVVKGFTMESYEEAKFANEIEKYLKTNIDAAKVRAFYAPLSTLIISMGAVVILWYGGGEVIRGAITLGNLVAFYLYVARLRGPIRMAGFMMSMAQRARAAGQRIFEIIDAEVEVSDMEDAVELKVADGRVVFNDVWFSYDGENMVLKDINLHVEPGDTVAILGATGSGKSSIINLIPRFYDVTRGSITVDGNDIRHVTIKSLRSHIGIVRQEPFIFSTTIRENIAYGVEGASLKEVVTAARRAKIHGFIASLPQGYETKVGERGVTLSGGQKQRIAIARALLRNPKILILDDSTSSVDTQTEFEIQTELEELFEERTTFIITQRISSVRGADYIVVLEDGEIVEYGTHEQLMAKAGVYYKLIQTQVTEIG